jgi:hypothetical protein
LRIGRSLGAHKGLRIVTRSYWITPIPAPQAYCDGRSAVNRGIAPAFSLLLLEALPVVALVAATEDIILDAEPEDTKSESPPAD